LPYLPRVQKEDVAKTYTSSGADYSKRGQPYFPLEPTRTIINLKPTFLPKLQPPPRIPTQLPQISFAILPTIQLHTPRKPNTHTSTNNILSSATPTNNIPHRKLANIPAENRTKQPTTTTTTTSTNKPRLTTSNKLSNLQKREHYCQGHATSSFWTRTMPSSEGDSSIPSRPCYTHIIFASRYQQSRASYPHTTIKKTQET
jgi:hypothetical protein